MASNTSCEALCGGAEFAASGVLSRVDAMRSVMPTFDESRLAKTGLRYTDWVEAGPHECGG